MSDQANDGYPAPDRLERYKQDYQAFHTKNPKRLSGKFPQEQIDVIKELVHYVGHVATDWPTPLRLLDYGSGKGYQYLTQRAHEQWGNVLPYCYDPGVIQLGRRPIGKFHGVICTDVLEHIEKQDLRDVLGDIFGYIYTDGPTFIYFHVCCRPAHKTFPDGRNLHATVQEPEWWDELIKPYATGFEALRLRVTYELAKVEQVKDECDADASDQRDSPTAE